MENALHVLLQYEEYAVPFGVVLNNSRESKCATIIGTEKDTIEKCARMLIQAGKVFFILLIYISLKKIEMQWIQLQIRIFYKR